MNDIMKKFLDIIYKIIDFLDRISEKIFEQTKVKVDLKLIIAAIIGIIILIIVVKSILSFIWGQL